jgi:hypothetical protein
MNTAPTLAPALLALQFAGRNAFAVRVGEPRFCTFARASKHERMHDRAVLDGNRLTLVRNGSAS